MQTHLRNAAIAADAHPDPDELITSDTARRLAGDVSNMTLWRWLKKGVIPQPLMIERRRYWRRDEFLAALQSAGSYQPSTASIQ